MSDHPVTVHVTPVTEGRNRLTAAFRFFLALPHLILVGGPAALGLGLSWQWDDGWSWNTTAGIIGHAVFLTSIVMWFVIVFTAAHVDALWRFAAFYLRWRVRLIAYLMLLRDEYPPFGDGDGSYPAFVELGEPPARRDQLTTFFRVLLALPHILILCVLHVVWAFTTAVAWVVIIFTGRYPETLYGFALGILAWTVRVEAYLLLLRDEYPPFSLRSYAPASE